jgi:hypothetical protein
MAIETLVLALKAALVTTLMAPRMVLTVVIVPIEITLALVILAIFPIVLAVEVMIVAAGMLLTIVIVPMEIALAIVVLALFLVVHGAIVAIRICAPVVLRERTACGEHGGGDSECANVSHLRGSFRGMVQTAKA